MKRFLQIYGAYLTAAILFLIIGFTYCRPVLDGKVLQSGDDINATSAVREAYTHDKSDGEYGFWNSSMFSGMPNYQIGGGHYKSSDLLRPVKKVLNRGVHGHPAWIIIFYLVCFFILLRSFGVDKWLAITGAIAIALSSYFIVIIAAGHGGKTIAISYISLVAAGFYLIFRKKYALGAIFTMFFTAIGFSIHPQMAYYLFMMTGVFFLAELWSHLKGKKYKELGLATLIFAASLGIGLGTGCSNIFANSEYATQTMRGGHSDLVSDTEGTGASKGLDIEYATQWSYGIDETITFLIPGFMGGASSYAVGTDSKIYRTLIREGIQSGSARSFCQGIPMYWGEQPFTSGNVYMGAIVCFLFLLGCLIVKGPYKWALIASTLFSVMLAWGSNFMPLTELFFKYFPMYNKFRAVSSILIVAEIAMPLLGFLALKEIFEGKEDRETYFRKTCIAAGITAGICFFFALFGRMLFDFTSTYDAQFIDQLPDWLYAAILEERAHLLRSDSWRSFLFICAAAASILLYLRSGRKKKGLVIAVLGVLIIADMWPVDKRYFNDSHFITPKNSQTAFQMQPYEQAILQDPDPHFRVMNLTSSTFNDARTSYYLKSVGGYSAAKLRRYQDIIDVHLSRMHLPVIGMLNAKYLITRGEDGAAEIQLNPYALGNAWFVKELKVVDNANEEIEALDDIELSDVAVLDREFAGYAEGYHPSRPEDASVRLTHFSPRYIEYESSSSADGTIVFSEIYYPFGWKASIDGVPADHFRVDYTLRALNVPSGRHKLHFEFDPDSVRKGDAIATVCILVMYLFIAGYMLLSVLRTVRRRKADA